MRRAPSPKVRRRMLMQAGVGLLVAGMYLLAAWFLASPQFHSLVRRRVISQLEEITGGKVELRDLSWTLSKMKFEVDGLIIHGLEGPGQVPYLGARHLTLQFKIATKSRTEIGLRFLAADEPVVHLIVYPDGHTNQPTPKAVRDQRNAVQRIFELAIDRAELHNGQLLFNERRIPLEMAGNKVHAVIDYEPGINAHYDGSTQIENIQSRRADGTPILGSARADFSLFPNLLQLKNARITSGKSFLEAEGVLQDFPDPHLTLTYRGNVDSAVLNAAGLEPQLHSGNVVLMGSGSYGTGVFSANGRLTARDVGFISDTWHGSNIEAAAAYSITNSEIKLSNLVARAMGGIATGSIDVVNWRTPATTPAKNSKQTAGTQTGNIRLHLDRFPVDSAAAAFSSRSLPLNNLRATGSASGNLEASWRGSPSHASMKFDLGVTPPAQSAPGEMPLTGQLAGVYDASSSVATFNQLNLSAPGITLRADGKLGRSGDLQANIAVSDIARLKPLLTAIGGQPDWMTSLQGAFDFNGKISGTAKAPTIAGHIQATNLSLSLSQLRRLLNGKGQEPNTASDVRVRVDSAAADLAYSSQNLTLHNGQLKKGSSQASFDLIAGLTSGRFTDSSTIDGQLTGRGGDLNDLQKILGYDYPLAAMASGDLSFSGTKANPHANGKIQLTNFTAFGETFRSLTAGLNFANHEIALQNISLLRTPGSITGSAAYNLNTDAIRFDLRGSDLNLASIQHLRAEKIDVGGTVTFTASGNGTTNAPLVNADASFRDLTINHESIGALNVQAATAGEITKIVARSNFRNAILNADGTIRLRGDFPVSGTLEFSKFDLTPVIRQVLPNSPAGTSTLEGKLTVEGPLRDWRKLQVRGDIPQLSATYGGIHTQTDGPINFTIADSVLRFQRFRLIGDDTEIDLRGSLELTGDREMNARANGRLNLKLLETLNRDINSSGVVTFQVNLTGNAERPLALGQIRVQNGAVSLIDLPNGLSEINGSLALNQDRIQIQNLTARTGGGEITLGGFANLAAPANVDLTVTGKDIRLRYPQGVSSTADLHLGMTGSLQNSTLSGDVVITRFGLTTQFDLAAMLARIKKPPELPRPDSPLNTLHLDVAVTSTPELRVQTSLARLSGDVDLRLHGTASKPTVLGRVNVNEGQISFNGQNYRLERGDVTFTNPVQIQPVIDFEATTRVREYDITLGFHGPADRLNTNYRSDPPLPEADIISLLAFGRTREDTALAANSTTTFSDSVSSAILGQAISSAVGNRMQRLFGVSHIRISPELSGVTDNNPNAQVSIEQQVSDKVTITYVTYVSQASQQSIQVEYNVNRNVSIVGARDQYGVFSFDVRLRQRKR